MGNKIILFNPKSAASKHRIPNSILQVGASIFGKYEFVFVDGNIEKDPWRTIETYFSTGDFGYFASTVMPGPQLKQAIPFSKRIKSQFPGSTVIWGGYFASNQAKVCLNSSFVDYVINGPGDNAFPALLNALNTSSFDTLKGIKNLIYKAEGQLVHTTKEALVDQDKLPALPYDYLNQFYPIRNYLGKTFLGKRTIAYHSSFGCPFSCSFCAVVPIYNARWKGKSAENMYKDVMRLKEKYGGDSIEFHDNNFFTSRKRTVEFARLMLNEGMNWWGEGRIDTMHQYSDEELVMMRASGCRMVFFGAETGNDEVLSQMNKGGNTNRTTN
jgi:anaerobic magnesium-protoporphyrin IX monomethyl ester cyclase